MTVASATDRVSYNTNGATTAFAVPFYFLEDTDLLVTYTAPDGTATTLVLTTDYTVSGAGDENGGSVVTTAVYPTGGALVIKRDVPITQETAFPANTPLPSDSLERALDKLTMIDQQLQEQVDRCFSVPDVGAELSAEFPAPEASQLLGWNSAKTGLQNYPMPEVSVGTYDLGLTGTVTRTLVDKLTESVSVKDFGAMGDGVTDDTAAIQAAIDYVSGLGRGTVRIPAGVYEISSTLTVTGNVSIVGEGLDLSVLQWTGAADGKMMAQTSSTVGARWHGFALNAQGVAGICLSLDRMQLCEVSSLLLTKATAYQLYMAPQSTASNCMMNTFTNLYLSAGGISLPGMIALHIGSDAAGVNCCHNTFMGLKLEHGHIGIQFGDADNNTFLMTYCFRRPEATGTPYEVDFAGGSATRSNYFFHFQGQAHASSGSNNTIEMYDKSNGQAEPVVDSGGILAWRESGQNAKGDYRSLPIHGLGTDLTGDWTADTTANVEKTAFKVYRSDNGQMFAVSLTSTPGRRVDLWSSNDGSGPFNVLSFGQNSLGFFGTAPVVKPAVTGSRGSNAALASLITKLASMGLITDSSTT